MGAEDARGGGPRDAPDDEAGDGTEGDGHRELEGTILRGREMEPVRGRVVVEDGRIAAVEETPTDSTNIVLPAFVNAHTHIGDSIAKEAGGGLSLDDLVAPPDGLKHRLLRDASSAELTSGMYRTMRFMEQSGTTAFVEFREGGVEGVEQLREASADVDVEPVVLGRDSVAAMEAADGFGASGARDGDFQRERNATAAAGKLFGIHAGERDPHDVNGALDLDPDFLVHVVHADEIHLERISDAAIPIVCCPRSNLVTGVGLPPFEVLSETTTLALGTDNVMLNSPSMFREMEITAKHSTLPADEILRMATTNGADLAGLDCGTIEVGREARLLVLNGDSHNLTGARDPVRAVVRRAGVSDVADVLVRPPSDD